MIKIPLKWILLGVLVLLLAGVISIQGPGVQCSGSMIYCPGVGCVSGPDKCNPGYVGGPSAVFSTTWEKFTNGKDLFPGVPTLSVGEPQHITPCSNGTRAADGRCPEFLAP
jgi:hypothetical protein